MPSRLHETQGNSPGSVCWSSNRIRRVLKQFYNTTCQNGLNLRTWSEASVLSQDFVEVFRHLHSVVREILQPGSVSAGRFIENGHQLPERDGHLGRGHAWFIQVPGKQSQS